MNILINLLQFFFPQIFIIQLNTASLNDYVIYFSGRIDNREEIKHKIRQTTMKSYPIDADLVLQATFFQLKEGMF